MPAMFWLRRIMHAGSLTAHRPCGSTDRLLLQNTVRGSRFTQNFKKGFVSQEYRSLLRRTEAPIGGLPEAICLVAVSPDGRVAGTLDLRPPACAADRQPKGVPKVRRHSFLAM